MQTASDPTPESEQNELEAPPSRTMTVTVYVSLAAAVLLGISLVVATGVRWMTQPTPSSIVVFHGDAPVASASISIVGVILRDSMYVGEGRRYDVNVTRPR